MDLVDKYDISADQLTYTVTLRDGLFWHGGKPVKSEDCVASIKGYRALGPRIPERGRGPTILEREPGLIVAHQHGVAE